MGGSNSRISVAICCRVSHTTADNVFHMLTQIYSLLARMPHTRKDKGKVVPLQTPQAFTNRSYRFRIPNQIPASKMTNGSATYKLQIIKSLEEQNAKTTETLSTLNPKQVEEVRKINKGKFKQNSRYVTKKDTESLKTPAPSLKRKARRVDDDETESEIEQEKPKAKKPYLPKPYEMGGAEAAVGTEASPGYVYDDTNGNAYPNEGNNHNVPTGNPRRWHGQEPYPSSAHHTGLEVGQSREDLVPLFASIDDQVHALNMDETFTSPLAVILARRHGHPLTEFIYVNWYRQSTPRHVGEDGMMVEDVVDEAFTFDEEAQEPIPSNNQPTLYVDQASINDIPVPVPDSYGPSHGVNPDILARTPSNSLLTPAMGLNAPDYGVYQDTLGQTASDPWAAPAMDLYASNHGIYPGVLRRPNNPPVPPLGPYVPAHNFYPDVVGQPSYPPVTPVENLNAPLPFPNQIGRYRTESDTSEEVWRNHHGSTGF